MKNAIEWEEKCWGKVCHLVERDLQVSVLKVVAGFRCSRHRHIHRWNNFRVITGILRVIEYRQNSSGDLSQTRSTVLVAGQSIDIHPGVWHCFEVLESGQVVEIYWTTDKTSVDFADIERIDVGGRIDGQ